MPESRWKLPQPPFPPRLPQWPGEEAPFFWPGGRRPPMIASEYGPQLAPGFGEAYGREQALRALEKARAKVEAMYKELQPIYDAIKYNTEGWSKSRERAADASSALGDVMNSLKDEIRKLRAQRR